MVTNGDNGTIGANGSNDDPFETMMIHWSYNGSNGDNGSNDDNGFNDDNGSNGTMVTTSPMMILIVATLARMTTAWPFPNYRSEHWVLILAG